MAVGPVWDHQAAGSNPVTRTIFKKSSEIIADFRGFLPFLWYSGSDSTFSDSTLSCLYTYFAL